MRESRLFKIVYHLLDKGQATALELAEKLEVSVRTIYRDIDVLSGAGIPVYTETGRNGGIHLMNDFVLDKAVLSEEEKREILTASIPCTMRAAVRRCRSFRPYFIWNRKTGWKWIFPDGAIKDPTMKSLRF